MCKNILHNKVGKHKISHYRVSSGRDVVRFPANYVQLIDNHFKVIKFDLKCVDMFIKNHITFLYAYRYLQINIACQLVSSSVH